MKVVGVGRDGEAWFGAVEKNGLQVYVMCELPSNVIMAEEFSRVFDGFPLVQMI